jgi:iron complex transport system ATP-binding protein
MTVLSARQVSVVRGGRAILDAADFDLGAGMFVALVGANGAGKSTLLACLAGLLRPDRGEVSLDGQPLSRMGGRELARRRAYLPQNPRAEWPIAVERLVALGHTPQLPAFGGLPGGFEPRLTEAIVACDLVQHRFQPATTLSGGELARAMLARALIGDPQVLLADEPTAGLDPRHALDTMGRLRRLAVEQGKLVMTSVHDMSLAARHATHLLALREGQVAAFGETRAVLSPALLRDVFDVDARIQGEAGETIIDYRGPA